MGIRTLLAVAALLTLLLGFVAAPTSFKTSTAPGRGEHEGGGADGLSCLLQLGVCSLGVEARAEKRP